MPAIVLCKTVTGIATVRALARSGVQVHACIFHPDDPTLHSRHATKVPCYELADDEQALAEFLIGYAKGLNARPVVFPTSDVQALFLARHAARLTPHCRIWNNSYEDLSRIVNKDGLYRAVTAAGLATIPGIAAPSFDALLEWTRAHAAPYIIKPNYAGVSTSSLREKNLVVNSREQLLSYVRAYGSDSLVIQRVLRGGDGNIFDCYGLCDAQGRVVTLTSHLRIRQYPPNFGATTVGEIPAPLATAVEERLFAATEQLFRSLKYHGIFGIEWLRDQATGQFYLIDFNARPFLTIGHLLDCGVNLPLLAHRELSGESLERVDPRPQVRRKRWCYLYKDIDSLRILRRRGSISIGAWLAQVAGCRSFAYASLDDPGPGIESLLQILGRTARYLLRIPTRRAKRAEPIVTAPTQR